MVIKKKLEFGELQSWHWFIPLFVMPCVFLFIMFSGNSYASIEYQTVLNTIDKAFELRNDATNKNYPTIEKIATYLETYDNLYCFYNTGSIYSLFFVYDIYFTNEQETRIACVPDMGSAYYNYGNSDSVSNNAKPSSYSNLVAHTGYIYLDNNLNSIVKQPNVISTPLNSIILTALHSGSKFTFTDKNQLLVELTGDYDISDFTFYIEHYNSIDDEWAIVTASSDYYRLTGYDNPYYIMFPGINYLDPGIYRYMALDSLSEPIAYSDSFDITWNYIDNSASGTINDGNIDIDIDTGETVDNIKDFMGSPADFDSANITQNDIENALNLNETINPYDNFVLTLINGLTSSLTGNSSTSWSFKVHSWGKTFTFYPSDVIPPYSQGLHDFLSIISTTFVVIVIVKWVTQIVESVNVGDVSKSLELIEEKYSDLL